MKALRDMDNLASYLNEAKRKAENMNLVVQLLDQITGYPGISVTTTIKSIQEELDTLKAMQVVVNISFSLSDKTVAGSNRQRAG